MVVTSLLDHMYLPIGPTKAPQKITIVQVMERKLDLSWRPIRCSDQNGEILQYVVSYYHQIGHKNIQEQDSKTRGVGYAMFLRNLRPNTDYTIAVAGVNSAGVGVFSLPIVATTVGGKPYTNFDVTCSHGMTTCSFIFH